MDFNLDLKHLPVLFKKIKIKVCIEVPPQTSVLFVHQDKQNSYTAYLSVFSKNLFIDGYFNSRKIRRPGVAVRKVKQVKHKKKQKRVRVVFMYTLSEV